MKHSMKAFVLFVTWSILIGCADRAEFTGSARAVDIGRITSGQLDVLDLIEQEEYPQAFARMCQVLREDLCAQLRGEHEDLEIQCSVRCDPNTLPSDDQQLVFEIGAIIGVPGPDTNFSHKFTITFEEFKEAAGRVMEGLPKALGFGLKSPFVPQSVLDLFLRPDHEEAFATLGEATENRCRQWRGEHETATGRKYKVRCDSAVIRGESSKLLAELEIEPDIRWLSNPVYRAAFAISIIDFRRLYERIHEASGSTD